MIYQDLVIVCLISYFIGSIPFGFIGAKLLGLGDIRQHGSGNIGATNAMRLGGKRLGILTFLGDSLKGILAILITGYYFSDPNLKYYAAFFAVVGHMFTIWLKFKGGKGIATTIAVILILNLPIGLSIVILWLITYYFTSLSSLASIASITIAMVASYFYSTELLLLLLSLWPAIILKHLDNIKRIYKGTELKI